MAYKYQNYCFDTVAQLHDYVAAQCPVISGGSSIVCTPQALPDQIQITATDLQTLVQTVSILQPQQISCDYFGTDYIDFLWLLAGLLVAAFGARCVSDVIRGR